MPRLPLPKSEIEKIQAWIDHEERDILLWDEVREKDAAICMESIRVGTLRPVSTRELQVATEPQDNDPSRTLSHSDIEQSSHEIRACERYHDPVLIGIGGFGVVISAFDRILGVPVALKFLRPSLAHLQRSRERFIGEAQTTASLSHPGIIRTYELACIDSHLMISCAFASGGSLAGLKTSPDLGWTSQQVAWLVSEIADAVQYAHSMATLHRDLKPANVLLVPSEPEKSHQLGFRPLISDFGLAKRMDSDVSSLLRTGDGQLLGTTRYMSPEQARGDSRRVGTGSDIYSMGVILFELLTGQSPFCGVTPFEIRSQIVGGVWKRPRSIRRSIPKDLEAITLKCLENEPANRYATAHELHLDLRRFLDGEPVQAAKNSWLRVSSRWVQRHPVVSCLVGLSIAAILLAILGLSTALVVQRQAMQQEAKWRTREQSTFREMVSMYSDITDQVIAGTPLELNELMPSLERSIPLLETSISENTNDLPLIHRLSVLKHYLAIGYQRLGDYPRSVQTREEVLSILDRLIEREPQNEKYRFDRFMSLLILADLRPDAPGGAQVRSFTKPTIENAIETIEALLREHPNNIDYQDAYAAALSVQASIVKVSDPSRAIQILRRVIKESKDLYSAHTDRPELAKHSYFASLTTAEILLDLGEQDEALAVARDGIAFYTQVRYPLKDETGILLEATNIQGRYRELLRKCGALESALAYSQDLQSIYRMLSSRELSAEYLVADIENHLMERWLLVALGRQEEAAACEKELLEKVSAAMDEPKVIAWLRNYEVSLLPERLVSLIREHQSASDQ